MMVFNYLGCTVRTKKEEVFINMTCIIGYLDKKNKVSWIGGDSLGSNGYVQSTESPSKVFRNKTFKNVLIGGTTTFRHLDLLKYSDSLLSLIHI